MYPASGIKKKIMLDVAANTMTTEGNWITG